MATMMGDLKIDDLGDPTVKVWSVNGLCKHLYVQSRSMRMHLQNTDGRRVSKLPTVGSEVQHDG
jgi:hypothetical protein